MSKRIVCENCDGQGYTDAGTSACGECFGVGVMTPELESRLSACTRALTALERIAAGTTTVFDEAEGVEVNSWIDEEEMSEIARTALAEARVASSRRPAPRKPRAASRAS